ncbi:MAG: hypothetical protein DRJ61_19035, partial [Acidobacteria bacterium]
MPQEAQTTFDNRKATATLKNYVSRSIEAMSGMIFRKPMSTIGYSQDMEDMFESVDLHSTLNQFSRELSSMLIRDGKVNVLVDSSDDADKPYFIMVTRLELINWKKDINGNFTLAVIKELADDTVGIYETRRVEQYRVYDENGNITIYRKDERTQEFIEHQRIVTDVDYIPLVEFDLLDIPPMYDIAKLNIKHMNRTSVKDRYLDMAACPVPVIWGANLDEDGGT